MEDTNYPHINDIKKTIDAKFNQTGFPTEEQVALTLLRDGWSVTRNVRYQEKDERPYHEIDILARKIFHKKKVLVQTVLVIECKKQETYPWVFASGSVQIRNPFTVNYVVKDAFLNRFFKFIEKNFKEHYYYNFKASTVHISPYYLWDKKTPDPIKEAIYQSIGHWKEIFSLEMQVVEQSTTDLIYVYPVIVLNGMLVNYNINNGVEQKDHILYLLELLGKEPIGLGGKVHSTKPIVIDVVTLSYFQKYLELIQEKGMLI